jgi:glyceraldehyde 3-phosphate dehydrogenase
MIKVAINGFGRIGRAAFKRILETGGLEIAAINDLAPPDNLAYLLQYDTVYGKYAHSIQVRDKQLVVNGKQIPLFEEKDPGHLPWEKLGVELVLECTGVFTKRDQLEPHLKAGAKKVILSAPAKDDSIPTIVHGVNVSKKKDSIISCASCTTNCIAPVVEIMGRRIGVQKAIMTTVHAYTTSQAIVDGPSKKFRRGRAGAMNFVPSSTGAAKATAKALPQYQGKFDGVAVRGPIPVGSLADIVLLTERSTTMEEINEVCTQEAQSDRYRPIVKVTEDPIVSSDVIGEPFASIIDLTLTQVVDGNLVKIMSWYDNEWGYACQMLREAQYQCVE